MKYFLNCFGDWITRKGKIIFETEDELKEFLLDLIRESNAQIKELFPSMRTDTRREKIDGSYFFVAFDPEIKNIFYAKAVQIQTVGTKNKEEKEIAS